MRFAGSNPAVAAMGVYSDYDPDALGKVGQRSRSLQRQNLIAGEALVDETRISNEGRLEAAKLGIAADQAQVPGMGEVIGMSVLEGLGNFAGPIASGMNSPGIGKGAAFGEVGTAGSDMASFGYTPAQDKAFHSGVGIDYGYL